MTGPRFPHDIFRPNGPYCLMCTVCTARVPLSQQKAHRDKHIAAGEAETYEITIRNTPTGATGCRPTWKTT